MNLLFLELRGHRQTQEGDSSGATNIYIYFTATMNRFEMKKECRIRVDGKMSILLNPIAQCPIQELVFWLAPLLKHNAVSVMPNQPQKNTENSLANGGVSQASTSHTPPKSSKSFLLSNKTIKSVGLIETKREVIDDFIASRLWPNSDYSFCFSPSSGASGGLLCLWDKKLLSVSRTITSPRWICIDFDLSGIQYSFFLVYGCSLAADRTLLWSNLLPELITDRFCFMVGDFNEILHPSERLNFSGYTAGMKQFMDFIQSSNLVEIQLQGRLFTWQNSQSRSKIDRCFVSADAFISWPNLSLVALPRNYSDHTPLLFRSAVAFDWGPKPFKSINAWWSNASFYDLVANSWKEISAVPVHNSLVAKLRELRRIIKAWNVNSFGNLNSKIESAQNSIEALEVAADFRILSSQEQDELACLRDEFNLVSKQLESLWLQKSRLNWNISGDKNSKFFHTIASVHSRNNFISEIIVDNQRFNTPESIKLNIQNFYKNLYKPHSKLNYFLDDLPIRILSAEQATSLSAIFTEEEIFLTLLGCDDNKAPGPDGFNYFFYKKAWKILKHDILQLFFNFHQTGFFPTGLNTAFLVLIPKLKGAIDIKDFRPISLINGVFKLLSKVLANRLSPILPLLISDNQFGFIKGRNIHDCHMIASELIHLANRRKDQVFLIKLDFKKAFDSISWDFILKVMARMNFDATWINWISSFFSSSQLSVLVNGSPSKNFSMSRGVRQGDPISPMLFVLAVEGLKALFVKAVDLGLIDGIHVDGYAEPISILQFADDTLLFVPKDMEMIRNLLRILRCFELVSGLEINYQKSSIIGINVEDVSMVAASSILNCKIEKLPITYLGLPLSLKPIKAKHWDPIISNFSNQLAGWKGNLLSPAGRLVLVKSVLCSLPVYYLSSFRIPSSVVLSLEQLMRRFLWSGSVLKSGFSKVSWVDVCMPFAYGGLNISPMKFKNQILLLKWIWKLGISDKLSLWFSVISCSSSLSHWFDIEQVDTRRLSHLWKGVHSSCVSQQQFWNFFKNGLRISLGSGENVRFWFDVWAGNNSFNLLFPGLFNLCRNKYSSVSVLFNSGQQNFSFVWQRRLRLGEQSQLSSLLAIISDNFPSMGPDLFEWNSKPFSPATFSHFWHASVGSPSPQLSRFWKFSIPPRIQFFMWLLARDRISSNALLARRGVISSFNSTCLLCSEEESSIHIILQCRFAWEFWNSILHCCSIQWAAPTSIHHFFDFWSSLSSKRYRCLWQSIWFFGIWELWKARNRRTFRHEIVDINSLVYSSICNAVIYYKDNNSGFNYSPNDVFRNLNFFCNFL
ncbi:uncharacterized protein LOC126675263 [Mercurialis annua]|uniref:uncharacterized protein LOC126675263 n=1 Tax=Mercurialis annua TaxID=3986 RepID=UPI00215ED59A|nr:uncharacterized protein LOC126675263 [Mercurialis annua]